jgi:acetyl esterase/lipase
MVGIGGNSSGGHQAVLHGMRPRDSRYSAIPLPAGAPSVDATVRCVIACSPVISPIGRYEYARKIKEGGKPYPEFVDTVMPLHDKYWQTEAAMAEGSPVIALERGERAELPPTLYVQSEHDIVHPRADLDRFVAGYRKAGGKVDLALFDGPKSGFIMGDPSTPAAQQAIEKIISFVHEQIR